MFQMSTGIWHDQGSMTDRRISSVSRSAGDVTIAGGHVRFTANQGAVFLFGCDDRRNRESDGAYAIESRQRVVLFNNNVINVKNALVFITHMNALNIMK